ncbi:hypothetical protein ACFL2H_12155, partial [Planctomycetota bacterium]
LRKAPEERYESAAVLANDLQRFAEGNRTLARKAECSVLRTVSVHRRRFLAALGTLAIGVPIGKIAVSDHIRRQRERAIQRRSEVVSNLRERSVCVRNK